jgi:hypothetical protein
VSFAQHPIWMSAGLETVQLLVFDGCSPAVLVT